MNQLPANCHPGSHGPTRIRSGFRKYFKVFTLGWQEQLEYRANYFFESLIGVISFLVLFFFWRAIYRANPGGTIAGLTFQGMLSYLLLAKFWSWIVDPTVEIDTNLPEDIRNGGLNRFLTRPISDRFYRFSQYLAHKILYGVMRIGPFIIIVFLFPRIFSLPPHPVWWFLPPAMILALILTFVFSYAIALCAFWFLEIWGVLFLKRLIVSLLAGAWVPLTLLPPKIAAVLLALPFQYMVFFPVQIALGKLEVPAIINGLGIQLVWIAVFSLLSSYLWTRGLKHYTGAGI